MRSTTKRRKFISENRDKSIEWLANETGVARSTIIVDLKAVGEDVKWNNKNLGREVDAMYREFSVCAPWNAVFKAMTTKQGVQL